MDSEKSRAREKVGTDLSRAADSREMTFLPAGNDAPSCTDSIAQSRLVASWAMLLALSAATGCSADAEADAVDPATGEVETALFGGTGTSLRPEIGEIAGRCTATLIHPRWVVSSASCLGYRTGTVDEFFDMYSSSGVWLDSRRVTYAHSVGTTNGPQNIMFARLSTPSTVAPTAVATAYPTLGQTVSTFGYGCDMNPNLGSGIKRYRDYSFGSSTGFACGMDQGGPRVAGAHNDTTALLWGVTGEADGSGIDKVGDLVQFGAPYARGIAAFGGTTVSNQPIPNEFRFSAAMGGSVRPLAGDFNGDGLGDVALVGGLATEGIPVAFGNGVGGFSQYTNITHPNFQGWSASARSHLTGDFDGDGDSDIALVGGQGWSTVPIAYSNRDGTFNITNEYAGDFATWAGISGVQAVAGDFSGDGVTDIALYRGNGWSTVPIQKRMPGGGVAVVNASAPAFASASSASGSRALVGRFAAGTTESIVLTDTSQVGTLPMIRLSSAGNTWVESSLPFVAEAHGWATLREVIAADFNGDGVSDFAYIGSPYNPSPPHVPFVLSGPSGFKPAYLPIPDFPAWGSLGGFLGSPGPRPLAIRRQGTTANDIMLVSLLFGSTTTFPVAHLRP